MAPNTPTSPLKIEFANSLSHGIGLLFGIAGVPLLVATAVLTHQTLAIIGATVYGFCFLFVFAASTIYHSVAHPEVKKALRIVDHISIYFQIVGSYTPFVLLFANTNQGLTLLAILWGATLLGTVFKIFFTHRFEWLSVGIYLLMGWSVITLPESFFNQIAGTTLHLIIAGGVAYTIGIIFYLWRALAYHHTIWHIFVLIGSICHFVAVWVALRISL